jgi:hypothetical protein
MRPSPNTTEAMTLDWIFEHPSDITRAFALWC